MRSTTGWLVFLILPRRWRQFRQSIAGIVNDRIYRNLRAGAGINGHGQRTGTLVRAVRPRNVPLTFKRRPLRDTSGTPQRREGW